MAKIPWWVWIVVGAGMYLIASRMENLVFFSYVGLFFIVIGIFKVLVVFIVGTKGKKANKEAAELRSHQFTCPNCRYVVATSFAYCPHCGTRLRY